jgi:hypothetical protein
MPAHDYFRFLLISLGSESVVCLISRMVLYMTSEAEIHRWMYPEVLLLWSKFLFPSYVMLIKKHIELGRSELGIHEIKFTNTCLMT